MNPQQHSSMIAQKVQLIYKLFLLENARDTFEEELRKFTNKAYAEVQTFLNSSFPTRVFSDLSSALDIKCQTFDKLSSLLKDLSMEPPTVKNIERTKQSQPLRNKGILKTDVFKFGPMLQNVLMASSIAKAVQVLGATLSLQKLKHFLISQSAAIQNDDMVCSISSSYNRAIQSKSLSCHLKAGEDEQAVAFEEKCQTENAILSPASIQSEGIDTERPPLLLPPLQGILPEISNYNPVKIEPQISWGKEDGVVVQHQKQTSSQLLHFLRAKAKIIGSMEVTFMECSKSMYTLGSSQQTTLNNQLSQFVIDDLGNLPASEACVDIGNKASVFKLKRVESSGSLTYSCVIATKSELWDIGDIFTEMAPGDFDNCLLENVSCQKPKAQVEITCTAIKCKTQSSLCKEHDSESNPVGAKTPVMTNISIPEFRIRKFEETEVVVSHIVSPGNFYIQYADCITKLQALVTDSWKATSSYALQNHIPDIGTQVMGWFLKQKQWCRAQVTKICGVSRDFTATDSEECETSIKVEVRRLDYGDTASLSLSNIRELTPDMAVLPLQAVQVSLANVMPVNGRDWSEEAVGWFRSMVTNRTLYARLYPQGTKFTVELFLEKGKLGAMRRGASLSLRLAQNGHAKHNKLKNVGLLKRRSK